MSFRLSTQCPRPSRVAGGKGSEVLISCSLSAHLAAIIRINKHKLSVLGYATIIHGRRSNLISFRSSELSFPIRSPLVGTISVSVCHYILGLLNLLTTAAAHCLIPKEIIVLYDAQWIIIYRNGKR